MGEKSGVVGKVVHYYWIIESAKKWIMECVNEHLSQGNPLYPQEAKIFSLGNE